ncbi:MAG: cohesin domain-containing protein [Patescibacteria group bacterium]|nr:cohesin domain-containing protein [Patescibacteria group bacterium]
MKSLKKIFFIFFLFLIFFFYLPCSVKAVKFDLIAPNPPENGFFRGDTIRFTINIDTKGASLNTTQIGMTYKTQYLEYVSVTPGEAMTSVTAENLGEGKLLFSGNNNSGFSGQGTFAYVDLKIIAQAPDETELCVLWAPSSTPSPQNTPSPQATNPPQPTTGIIKSNISAFLGTAFIFFSIYIIMINHHYFRFNIKKKVNKKNQ